jgi:hypothetical protein
MYPRAQSLIITKQVEDIYIYLVLLNATILPIRVLPVGKDQQRDDIIADNFLQMIACLAKHLWPNTNSVPTCKESVYTKKNWPGYIKTAKKKGSPYKGAVHYRNSGCIFFFCCGKHLSCC